VDGHERERHERVSDRAHPDCPRDVLVLLPRQQKAARSPSEGQDARLRVAVRAGPEEESRRPELEAAELTELNLEAALATLDALGRAVPFDQTHRNLNLYA
jgi:hypothetical protein